MFNFTQDGILKFNVKNAEAMMAKGNHEQTFYVCANMNYGPGVYDQEFRRNNVPLILYSEMFFACMYDSDFSHLVPPRIPNAIVEIHGLGPDRANVGIYTDNIQDLPEGLQIRLVFKHLGSKHYCQIKEIFLE